MTGFNLPPGVNVSDLPGWSDPGEEFMHFIESGVADKGIEIPEEAWAADWFWTTLKFAYDAGHSRGTSDGHDEALMEQAYKEEERAERLRQLEPSDDLISIGTCQTCGRYHDFSRVKVCPPPCGGTVM